MNRFFSLEMSDELGLSLFFNTAFVAIPEGALRFAPHEPLAQCESIRYPSLCSAQIHGYVLHTIEPIFVEFMQLLSTMQSSKSEKPGYLTVFRVSCSSALLANLIVFFIFRSEYIFYTIEPIFVEFVQELFAIQSWKSEKPCFLTVFRVSCSSALWVKLLIQPMLLTRSIPLQEKKNF